MQKWCPEPFATAASGPSDFRKMDLDADSGTNDGKGLFRPESGYASPEAMLRSLSRKEREQVVELIDRDLKREYEERHKTEMAALAEEAALAAANLTAWKEEFSESLEEALQSCLAQLATRISDFAVLMASKIVRREVVQDPDILIRNLETVLFKARAGCILTVTVHPEDADRLKSSPELREKLRIKEVKEDRRIERGGCLVKADDEEWDATISRQLEALGETLETTLACRPAEHEKDQNA
jgi:flagellar biosynthesis/type III secretory pathway protein FliH